MAVLRSDKDQVWAADGNLLSSVDVQRDITNEANTTSLQQRAQTALTNNQTFLALPSPTNTQVLAQVRALTRQVNALIRLQLALLADISDT